MAKAFDIDALKANGFATDNRKDLEKAHHILLGYEPEEFESNDVIRGKLREIAKVLEQPKEPEKAPESNVTPLARANELDLRKMPNLTATGAWGGLFMGLRWRKRDTKDTQDVITARWETREQDLLPDTDTWMPYPLYRAFIDAVDVGYETDYSHDFDKRLPADMRGRLIATTKNTSEAKYILTDLGPKPGTEHLPRDYFHFFQTVATKTQMFNGVSRTMLMRVYNILFGDTPITRLVGVSDRDLRVKIAVSLGPDYEHMMDEELYGNAAVSA